MTTWNVGMHRPVTIAYPRISRYPDARLTQSSLCVLNTSIFPFYMCVYNCEKSMPQEGAVVIYELKVVDWGMYHQFKGDITELQ